jgi:hypothetical protein
MTVNELVNAMGKAGAFNGGFLPAWAGSFLIS